MNRIQPQDLADFDAINRAIEKTTANLEAMQKALLGEMAALRAEAANLQKTAERLNTSTAKGVEETDRAAKQADELTKRYKAYEASLSDTAVELAAVRNAQQIINQVNKLTAKETAAMEGSYNKLSAQLSIMKIRWKQLSEEERNNSAEGRQLTKNIQDIDKQLKELDASVGVHTRNVGNYRDAIADLPGVFGVAGRGVQGLGDQFKALLRNPVVLVIGLISGALVTLFQAFQRSEKGAQFMARATGFLNGIMSALVGVVDAVVEKITAFADDPVASIKALGKAVVENITNRLEGALLMVGNFGKALGNLLTGDFKGAEQAFKDAGTAALQFTTGLDAEQQKAFGQAVRDATKEVVSQTNAFIALEDARRRVAVANRELTKSAEKLQTVEELNRSIADDNTKSFQEREQAAEKARAAMETRAAKEIEIARNNLSLINQEIDLRKANGENIQQLLDNQLEAYRAFAGAEREYTLAVRDNEKQRAELKQDRLERDLDILIDGFDNQKTINERLIADETRTFGERRALLIETQKLADDSFKKQIETIQQFTGVAVNANELIAESDAVALNQKIRSLGLSEIIEGRLLEIVRERRLAVQDLNDAEKQLAASEVKAALEREKAAKEARDKALAFELEKFDKQQELVNSEFALLKKSEKEKEIFTLIQQRERMRKQIEIARQMGGELSDVEIQTFENTVKAIDQKIEELKKTKKGFSIWDAFYSDDLENRDVQIAQFKTALDSAKQALAEYQAAVERAAAARVAASDRAVSAAENEYNRQTELAAAGLANRSDLARRELEAAKKRQQEALENQRRVQRQQILLNSALEASNLAIAISKLFAEKNVLAIPLAAIMVGAFVASKAAAIRATKQEFATGGHGEIGGGTHASGRDTNLGFKTKSGKQAYAQRGELFGIVRHERARQYKPVWGAIVDSMNAGTFERQFASITRAGDEITNRYNVTDTRRMEGFLSSIDSSLKKGGGKGAPEMQQVGPGVFLIREGNWTRTEIRK